MPFMLETEHNRQKFAERLQDAWHSKDFADVIFCYTDAKGKESREHFEGSEVESVDANGILFASETFEDCEPTIRYRKFRFDRMTNVRISR